MNEARKIGIILLGLAVVIIGISWFITMGKGDEASSAQRNRCFGRAQSYSVISMNEQQNDGLRQKAYDQCISALKWRPEQ